MAGKWRQLAPHFLVMFIVYVVSITFVAVAFGVQSFWISLAIALGIALFYPTAARSLGVEPEVWKRAE